MNIRRDIANHREDLRNLKLIADISEDWGKSVTHLNEFMIKGRDTEEAEEALFRLHSMASSLDEIIASVTKQVRKPQKVTV